MILRLETKLGLNFYAYFSQDEGSWQDFTQKEIQELLTAQVFRTHNDSRNVKFKTIKEVKNFLIKE